MNNQIKEWPISPTFLSLRQGCKEEDANYNRDGIFYTDYLRGFLADLSHDYRIQNALSIFQFVPEDFLPLDPNAKLKGEIPTDPKDGTVLLNTPLEATIENLLKKQKKKIIRIDSGTFVNNGKLCDAFRRCGEKNFCFRQDSIVGIFSSDELNSLDPNSDEDREKLNHFIEKYNQVHEGANIQVDDIKVNKKKRTYIHYTCPISLFEEHIFPIYVHGHVIACLMFGQMARIKFDRNKTFSDFRDEMKHKNGDAINYDTIEITSCIEKDEWDEKAQAIVERIIIFEKRLDERIEHRNIRYVNEAFEVIENQFLKEVKKINIKEEGVFHKFTEALNKAFSDIRNKFDDSEDGFIRMFALPIDIEHDELVPIGWAGSYFEVEKSFKIALKQLKGIESTLDVENKKERIEKQRKIILEASNQEIKDLFDEKKDFFLPGWLAGNEVAYIVWKRHSSKLRYSNKKNFILYRKTLKKFYSTALECYSYIRGSRMELLLETAIKVSAHESAHFILPAIDAVENHLKPLPEEMILSIYAKEYSESIINYEKYKDEVLELLDQLNIINSGSSLIFLSELKINKEEIAVFYLLYKLKLLLSNRAKDSHKSIIYEQSVHYMDAYVDVTYINHALYNLLDNAIKYGHEGSNIYINMDVDKHKQKLIIRITSYGIGIPKEEEMKIYNLFERGAEASSIITRGNGLGMYIVQKICKAHGGKVTHKSEKLSDYNIPVLFNYKNKNNLANDCSKEDILQFEKETTKLSSKCIEKEVVNDSRFVRYPNVFSTRINKPTYRNTFIVTIPLH